MVSVSEPWPSTMRPSSSSRTVVRAWASAPSVIALMENRFSAASCGKTARMAVKAA